VLKLPQPNRSAQLSTAFISVDGIIYDLPVFRGNNSLSRDKYLWFFENNLRKQYGFFCASAFYLKSLGISTK
jgi:hypothetical protein